MIQKIILGKLWKKYTLDFRPWRFRIWSQIFDNLTPSENFPLSFPLLIKGDKKYDTKIYFVIIMKKIHPMFLIMQISNLIPDFRMWKIWYKNLFWKNYGKNKIYVFDHTDFEFETRFFTTSPQGEISLYISHTSYGEVKIWYKINFVWNYFKYILCFRL